MGMLSQIKIKKKPAEKYKLKRSLFIWRWTVGGGDGEDERVVSVIVSVYKQVSGSLHNKSDSGEMSSLVSIDINISTEILQK